jgi:hypothetical protein
MQVRTERSLLNIGNGQRPAIHLDVAPRSSSGHLFLGIAIGVAFGFIAGTVLTALVGEKSLLLAQHLWSQITRASASADGERVHFEWLLQ